MKRPLTQDPRIGVTHNRALCCECGTLRLVAARFRSRRHVYEGASPESVAELKASAYSDWYAHLEPWHRMLCDLKCQTCRDVRPHAILRDCCKPEFRDCAERVDYGLADEDRRNWLLILEAGVRIRRVPDLDEGWLYLTETRLLLLDVESTAEEVSAAMEMMIEVIRNPDDD